MILRRYWEKEKILLVEEKEREDKYLENVIFFLEESKNCEGQGGKYLEKENISLWIRRKMEKE